MILNEIELYNELPPFVQTLIIRFIQLILILLLIIVLRRVLTWIVIRPLRRLVKRTNFDYDDVILQSMMTPMRLAIIAIAISISVQMFNIGDGLDRFMGIIARTLIIIALLMGLFKLVDVLMPTSTRMSRVTGIQLDDRLIPFLRTGLKLVVIALGIVIVLQEWGYDVSGLIAGLGLGGLAFSLAAQDTVSNLFGFAAIVSDNPFKVGEYIKTPDVEGIVEHVGLRSTRVRQLDQAVVYVPNNKLASSAILNWSRLSKRRLDYVLGITYDASSGQMRVLLHRIREMLKSQELVDPDSVVVYFVEFGASSLDILIRCYIYLSDWAEFQAEKERLHLLVMDIVNDLNMSIAFPSMSLYVENLPPITSEFDVEKPKSPKLSPREQALMHGHALDEPSQVKANEPEEGNITGQQDEGDK
ncbi:MAG: hypothetical protein CUN56_02845 [Phototrophicales bacterium]|nr:MAG: hypothetical protein CUN56_02845 [Phototrophicales bacterium]RMG72742.1 MAG: mechanosensitive ion channel family protein [Chloroflexota bacterium]